MTSRDVLYNLSVSTTCTYYTNLRLCTFKLRCCSLYTTLYALAFTRAGAVAILPRVRR